MKHIKSVLALMLAVLLLCGCGASVSADDLAGKWSLTAQSPEDEATYLLDSIDLYDEERAYVDMGSLNYVIVAEFGSDGSYSFAYDVDANKACVRAFYEGVMDALFENRAALSELYGTDLGAMTREEFNQFYASLYGETSYEVLMDGFVEYAYEYSVLAEPLETGTFKMVGSTMMCTITGETEAEGMGVKLDGDTLTLTFSDGEEVYTRVE